jgi:hypothetical protein
MTRNYVTDLIKHNRHTIPVSVSQRLVPCCRCCLLLCGPCQVSGCLTHPAHHAGQRVACKQKQQEQRKPASACRV